MLLHPRFVRLRKWLLRAALIFIAWFVLHCALISWDGFSDSATASAPADAAVVLGNGINADGTPNKVLRARLEKTVELYRQGAARYIVCSGGTGPGTLFEAEIMHDFLVAKGVDPAIIIVDRGGKDSYSTAQNAAKLFAERGWHSALIVSSFTHISRCKLAFRRFGLTDLRTAHADFQWRDCKAFPHEFFGYYYYLVRKY
ncbi:MAG TPA: YdcF family protein [Planctomycetota bacterium]|nr:YdcF family protein [Planctomycetota bacterium]